MSTQSKVADRSGPAVSVDLPLSAAAPSGVTAAIRSGLRGKRVGMVTFSSFPADPRPRRAAEALLKEGMLVDLICQRDDTLPNREDIGGLKIFRIPITHHRGGKFSYAYQYSAFILMSAAILAWRSLWRRYALIYIHNMPDVLVFSALLPKALGARVVLDQHDPMPELMMTIFRLSERGLYVRLIKCMERWSLARAHLVVTVNCACRRIFAARGCALEKIGVVMNTPDDEIFPLRMPRSYGSSAKKKFVIMYHGSLVERNGLDIAVNALARVRQSVPGAELRIFGRSTPFLKRVLQEAGNLGLQEAVRYLGPKNLEELVAEIQDCDVGIIPNQRNAFTDVNTPTRIFEYLALGKPVVAPNTPGIQDYFNPGALLFFETGNSDSLAEQIAYVFAHPGNAMHIAERGQQIYLRHTWSREREALVTLISSLLTRKKTA